jgi:hypothetical protein
MTDSKIASAKKALASGVPPSDGVPPWYAAKTLGVSVQTHYRTLRHLGYSTVADLRRCMRRNLGGKPLLVCRTLRRPGYSIVPDVRRCMQRNLGGKPLLVCRTLRHLGYSNFDRMGQRKPRSQDHRQ